MVSRVSLASPNLRIGDAVPSWGTRKVCERDCDTDRSGVSASVPRAGCRALPLISPRLAA